MIFSEKRFAYRHTPSKKWVFLEVSEIEARNCISHEILMHFLSEFDSAILYCAKNVLEEDLLRSLDEKGEKYALKNFSEFELVEIEIEYRAKA